MRAEGTGEEQDLLVRSFKEPVCWFTDVRPCEIFFDTELYHINTVSPLT